MNGLRQPQRGVVGKYRPLGLRMVRHKHMSNDNMWQQFGCNNPPQAPPQGNTWMVIFI